MLTKLMYQFFKEPLGQLDFAKRVFWTVIAECLAGGIMVKSLASGAALPTWQSGMLNGIVSLITLYYMSIVTRRAEDAGYGVLGKTLLCCTMMLHIVRLFVCIWVGTRKPSRA